MDTISSSSSPDRNSYRPIGQSATLHVVHQDSEFVTENACSEEIPVTIEEPWSDSIEQWLNIRLSDAKKSALLHQTAGYRLKFKQRLLGFIVISVATLVFVVNSLLSCSDEFSNKIILVTASALNVFFSTLYSQLDMGKISQLHFEYEAKFVELAEDICYELAKQREFRMASDAFMMMIKERVKRLSSAPEYPQGKFFFC